MGKKYSSTVSRKIECLISKTDAIDALWSALEMAKGQPINELELLAFVIADKKFRGF